MRNIIAKIRDKVKPWAKSHRQDLILTGYLLLSAGIGYNIGLMRAGHMPLPSTTQDAVILMPAAVHGSKLKPTATRPTDQRVVASKNSKSKLYHHPWCPGAAKIKESNQVWFDSSTAAEAAGYTLAANCQ